MQRHCNLVKAFEWFCEWIFAAASRLPGRKVLLTDEAWKYCSAHKIPFALSNCVQTGRKRGLELLFVVQQPNKLNEAILNVTTELVCFRVQGNNGLECLADLGVSVEEVANLPLGSFVARDVRSGAGNCFSFHRRAFRGRVSIRARGQKRVAWT